MSNRRSARPGLRTVVCLAVVLIVWLSTGPERELWAAQWPCIQGNPQHTGRTESVVFDAGVFARWEVVTGGAVAGCPIIGTPAEDLIVVSTGNGKSIRGFRPDGTSAFAPYSTFGSVMGAPAFGDDGCIYAADITGRVYRIISTGSPVWTYRDPAASDDQECRFLTDATPSANGGVYLADWLAGVRLVRSNQNVFPPVYTGNYPKAPVTVDSSEDWFYYPIRVMGGAALNREFRVYCGSCTNANEQWSTTHIPIDDAWTFNSLQVSGICLDEAGGRLFVSANYHSIQGSFLYCLDSGDGSLVWADPVDLGVGSYAVPALSPDGKRVYITTLDGCVRCFNASTHNEAAWSPYVSGAEMILGSVVVDGHGKLLFGDSNGVVHCLNPDGTVAWKYEEDDSPIGSSPAIMDNGDVVYGTMNGKLKRLTRAPLEVPFVETAPTLDGTLASNEWASASRLENVNATEPGVNFGWNPLTGTALTESDCSFDLYLMHDGASLYVAVDVTDDVLNDNHAVEADEDGCYSVWKDDSVQLMIDGDFDQDYTEGTFDAPDADTEWYEGQTPSFAGGGQYFWDNRTITTYGYASYGLVWDAASALKVGGGGYVVEFRVGFNGIDTADGPGEMEPLAVGDVIGLNIVVNDIDTDPPLTWEEEKFLREQVALAGGDFEDKLFTKQDDWVPVVLVSNMPTARFEGSPAEACVQVPVQFTDLSTGSPTSWLWNFGDGSEGEERYEQNPEHTYVEAGVYTVSLTVTNANGEDTAEKENYIIRHAAPEAGFTTDLLSGQAPLQVRFEDTSTGGVYQWIWHFGDGGGSSDPNPTYEYADPGAFPASLTVNGTCGGDTSDPLEISVVLPPPEITTNNGEDFATGQEHLLLEGLCHRATKAVYVYRVLGGTPIVVEPDPGPETDFLVPWSRTFHLNNGQNPFYVHAIADQGVPQSSTPATIVVTLDTTKPIVVDAEAQDSRTVKVVFDDIVVDATPGGLTAPDSYEFTAVRGVELTASEVFPQEVSKATRTVVFVTVNEMTDGGEYVVSANPGAIQDQLGSPLDPDHCTASFSGENLENPDLDEDGMPDRWEVSHGCLDPTTDDSEEHGDDDGLSNGAEYELNSDPCNGDDPYDAVYVSPTGDDSNDGSEGNPWRTIGHAMEQVAPFAAGFTNGARVTIFLAPGTYNEPVKFRPNTAIVGTSVNAEKSIIRYNTDADARWNSVIVAEENTCIERCTITEPLTPLSRVYLVDITNVTMHVKDCVIDGKWSDEATGIIVRGEGSSGSLIRGCVIRNVLDGVLATDSAANITRNKFKQFKRNALFVALPDNGTKNAEAAKTPELGSIYVGSTGLNHFSDPQALSYQLVKNATPKPIQAQYNCWGVFTETQLAARSNGAVNFNGYISTDTTGVTSAFVVLVHEERDRLIESSAITVSAACTSLPEGQAPSPTFAVDENSRLLVVTNLVEGAWVFSAEANGLGTVQETAWVPDKDAVFVTLYLPAPIEDINCDVVVNALDVQLVINGALGLAASADGDVTHDDLVNALDVQKVINKALGL